MRWWLQLSTAASASVRALVPQRRRVRDSAGSPPDGWRNRAPSGPDPARDQALTAPVRILKALARSLLHLAFGSYGVYWIYSTETSEAGALVCDHHFKLLRVDADDVARARDRQMQEQARYGGEGAIGFGVYDGDDLLCVQWYWHGDRYRQRNFWPLRPDEAKSVQLFTVAHARGRGLARLVKRHSANALHPLGFRRLYSRVWYSHAASIAMNEAAGWNRVALVAEVCPFGRKKPWRVTLCRYG